MVAKQVCYTILHVVFLCDMLFLCLTDVCTIYCGEMKGWMPLPKNSMVSMKNGNDTEWGRATEAAYDASAGIWKVGVCIEINSNPQIKWQLASDLTPSNTHDWWVFTRRENFFVTK